jgi:hypothetical protein
MSVKGLQIQGRTSTRIKTPKFRVRATFNSNKLPGYRSVNAVRVHDGDALFQLPRRRSSRKRGNAYILQLENGVSAQDLPVREGRP